MNLVEKLESWRWIKPIPSKLPKKSEKQSQRTDKKNSNKNSFSSFASHLQEWQKEQKYKSSGLKFSAISHGIAKSARKFKSELDKIKSKTIFSRTDRFRETEVNEKVEVTLLYQSSSNKRNQKFVRLNEETDENDSEDFYLVPKTPKLVTFAESTSSISTNSISSLSENQWLWSVLHYYYLSKNKKYLLQNQDRKRWQLRPKTKVTKTKLSNSSLRDNKNDKVYNQKMMTFILHSFNGFCLSI